MIKRNLFFLMLLFLPLSAKEIRGCSHANEVSIDSKGEHLFVAIRAMEDALGLAKSIGNSDVKLSAIEKMESFRSHLQWSYLAQEYETISEDAHIFSENLHEILADCDNEKIKLQIIYAVAKIVEELVILDSE